MSSKLQFELTSPDKMAFAKPVAMVIVPGSEGRYGVLPGHAPMVTAIAPGLVEIVYEEHDTANAEHYFVTGGYCEVTTDRCSLLADDILKISSFVKDDIQKELAELIAARGELGPEESAEAVDSKIAIAMAKLQLVA